MKEIILEVFVLSFQTTKSKDESYFNKTSTTPVVKPGSKVMSAEYVLYRLLDRDEMISAAHLCPGGVWWHARACLTGRHITSSSIAVINQRP